MGEHREREKRKWLKPLEILGRYKYVLVVVALGALLLAWPQGTDKENNSAVSEETADAVGELAELVHFHPNYFVRFFKERMGVPPAFVARCMR